MKKNNSKIFSPKDKSILTFNKCLFGVTNNNYINYSDAMNLETVKIISEKPRVQNMNSDIINYI